MNHLLHQISWHQYLTVGFLAIIIYYLFVGLRFYRPELQNLQRRISGDKPGQKLQALQYQTDDEVTKAAPMHDRIGKAYHEEALTDTDILAGKLKACIVKAADKPFAPDILIPQLKQALQDHQYIAVSEKLMINHLIVNECEKNGTALLTEKEVDQWWES